MKLRSLIPIILSFVFMVITIPTSQAQGDCVVIVGDSLPFGSSVTLAPNVNYVPLKIPSFADVLQWHLNEQGIPLTVINASEPAVDLRDDGDGHPSYYNTDAYQVARGSSCRYALVFPWLNELPTSPDNAAMTALRDSTRLLLQNLRAINPHMSIIVVALHRIQATETANATYGLQVSTPVINAVRTQYRFWCTANTGDFAILGNLRCYEPFSTLRNPQSYVMNQITQAEFVQGGYYAMTEQGQNDLSFFWSQNAGQLLLGDGVHYNPQGMAVIAIDLIEMMQEMGR